MEKYETIKAVGDGSFGSVTKARNKFSNDIVAIKRMKAQFASWDEAMKLREVKSLRKMNHHNIVKLKEVIRQKDSLFFVFEFMENNLYEIISKNVTAPTEQEIKLMAYDSLQGIAACHKNGYFHRDLKPENLLINNQQVVKLADFGLAREIRSRPPFTEYVSTRWYRAPELLLSSPNYNSPIDVFAMGCILAEMYLLRPLAPGNSEADQLMKLCLVLGTPPQDWTEGYQLATQRRIDFPKCPVTPLQSIIPNASSEAIDLILKMLQWDPNKRPTAQQCLQHPFFTSDIRAEYQRKLNVSMQHDREDSKRAAPNGGAGFMQLRNSQKGLQSKQMSQGALSPLTNNASIGAINQDASNSSFVPKLPGTNAKLSEQQQNSIFGNGKGSVIKRDSVVFKMDHQPTSHYSMRNNKNGIQNTIVPQSNQTPLGAGSPIKLWDTNTSAQTGIAGDPYGAGGYLRQSNNQFSTHEIPAMNQNNNRGMAGAAPTSMMNQGQKVIIAPKLQGSLMNKPPGAGGLLSSGSGMGSSSILNLPVLGQENVLMPTNRGIKGIESTKQLMRHEEGKISGQFDASPVITGPSAKQPSYYSRSTNENNILSPASNKDKQNGLIGQTSRNMSVLNMKKSSARFLSPINQNENSGGGIGQQILNNNSNKMTATVIDKYPTGGSKVENNMNPMSMPGGGGRALRETKNNQLFEKYMNRHQRKASNDMMTLGGPNGGGVGTSGTTNIENHPSGINGGGAAISDFALPSLGGGIGNRGIGGGITAAQGGMSQISNRGGASSNFSSRQKKNEQVRASISDSDFDF